MWSDDAKAYSYRVPYLESAVTKIHNTSLRAAMTAC